MTRIFDIANHAEKHLGMDHAAATAALLAYKRQMEVLDGQPIDADNLSDEQADFLRECIGIAQGLADFNPTLDEVAAMAHSLAEHDMQREHLVYMRDQAVRAAAAAGANRQDIAEAAGMSRPRVYQILGQTRP